MAWWGLSWLASGPPPPPHTHTHKHTGRCGLCADGTRAWSALGGRHGARRINEIGRECVQARTLGMSSICSWQAQKKKLSVINKQTTRQTGEKRKQYLDSLPFLFGSFSISGQSLKACATLSCSASICSHDVARLPTALHDVFLSKH